VTPDDSAERIILCVPVDLTSLNKRIAKVIDYVPAPDSTQVPCPDCKKLMWCGPNSARWVKEHKAKAICANCAFTNNPELLLSLAMDEVVTIAEYEDREKMNGGDDDSTDT